VQAEAKIVLLGRYTAGVTKVLVEEMIAEQVTVTNGAPALPPMRPRRQPDGEQRIGVSGQLAQPGQHVGDPGLIHLGTRTRPATPAPRPPQTERSPRPGGGVEAGQLGIAGARGDLAGQRQP
jgi:hypothetical protein